MFMCSSFFLSRVSVISQDSGEISKKKLKTTSVVITNATNIFKLFVCVSFFSELGLHYLKFDSLYTNYCIRAYI